MSPKKRTEYKFDIVKQEIVETQEDMLPYLLGDTPGEAEEIYQQFEKKLNGFAKAYAAVSKLEKHDLFSEALIGLGRAVRDFDNNRSDNFNTYAIYRIKEALDEYTRGMSVVVSIPAYIKKANTLIKRIEDKTLSKDKCKEASKLLKKAAKRAEITTAELIKRARVLPSNVRFDEDHINMEEHKIANVLAIKKLFEKMTMREKQIAERIMDGYTQAMIAEDLKITDTAVSLTLKGFRNKLERWGIKLEDIL